MQLNKIPFANSCITVYNRFEELIDGKKRVGYKGHVLCSCLFQRVITDRVSGLLVSSDDEFVAIAPNDSLFLPYEEWKNNKEGHFTCNASDVIVRGEFLHIIPHGVDCISYLRSIDSDIGLRCFTAREARFNDGVEDLAHFYWREK